MTTSTPLNNTDLLFRERLRTLLGGEFELAERLGVGGFAEVFAARDKKLDRDVAIKTIRRDFYGVPSIRDRFLREARTVAQLRHPNILPVYSVAERDEIAYFVMPLVRGESLASYLERVGYVPTEEAQRILVEIAAALHYAHQKGLVHRDVKPENVMLEGSERRVMVMDFGIAKAATIDSAHLTGTGMIVGTPLYMSPEQASGERDLDARADLYSLGVVAFQMLTGELPFTGGSAQAIIVKHITEEAPAVSDRRPDCPPNLSAAIRRCLAKDPAARFSSLEQFSAALRGELAADGASEMETRGEAVLRTYRRFVGAAAGVTLLAGVIDVLANGGILYAPFVAALAVLAVGLGFGPVWRAGWTVRDVMRSRERRGGKAMTRMATSETYAAHAGPVAGARSDRAVIAGLLARMPRAQRERLPAVLSAADAAVAHGRELGRKLAQLDRVIEQAGSKDGSNSGVIREAEDRRAVLAREMAHVVARLAHMRHVMERVQMSGLGETEAELLAAAEAAAGRTPVDS